MWNFGSSPQVVPPIDEAGECGRPGMWGRTAFGPAARPWRAQRRGGLSRHAVAYCRRSVWRGNVRQCPRLLPAARQNSDRRGRTLLGPTWARSSTQRAPAPHRKRKFLRNRRLPTAGVCASQRWGHRLPRRRRFRAWRRGAAPSRPRTVRGTPHLTGMRPTGSWAAQRAQNVATKRAFGAKMRSNLPKCPTFRRKCPTISRALCRCVLCFHTHTGFVRLFLTSFSLARLPLPFAVLPCGHP